MPLRLTECPDHWLCYCVPFCVMWCRLGQSKDDHRNLPQAKFILSVLEPLDLLVATDVMQEQRAIDHFYRLVVTRVHGSLGHLGLLAVRDSTLRGSGDPSLYPGWR